MLIFRNTGLIIQDCFTKTVDNRGADNGGLTVIILLTKINVAQNEVALSYTIVCNYMNYVQP